jgi:hypothetical protein
MLPVRHSEPETWKLANEVYQPAIPLCSRGRKWPPSQLTFSSVEVGPAGTARRPNNNALGDVKAVKSTRRRAARVRFGLSISE